MQRRASLTLIVAIKRRSVHVISSKEVVETPAMGSGERPEKPLGDPQGARRRSGHAARPAEVGPVHRGRRDRRQERPEPVRQKRVCVRFHHPHRPAAEPHVRGAAVHLAHVPVRCAAAQRRLHAEPGATGPIEGRPPGPIWAHQGFTRFPPQVAIEVTTEGAKANATYNPGVASSLNSGINPASSIPLVFNPSFPVQGPLAVWTFNGTIPPKLARIRYGEPVLFRHHNKLPFDITQNGGFGRHTISTHKHNAHHGAENDGFTGAFFFPAQFYDYHWPIVLAGFTTINTGATDPRAGMPNDAGGITNVAGDWHETMSTHWFHDHMFSFTSQNVYKGMAAMANLYSSLDRGAEDINDGVNLRLPSGRASVSGKSWGNLDYDVNLMLADKAWDANGQLFFDIFQDDGFLGDRVTVNLAYKPFFEV